MKEYDNLKMGKIDFEGILKYNQKRKQKTGENSIRLISKTLLTYLGSVFGCKVKQRFSVFKRNA
jgi:hypothetical protein